jgi:PAS domain S-box-containing protein
MPEFLHWLLATNFMPHVYCLRDSATVALHAFSDGATAFAYFVIPCILIFLVRRRRDLEFRWAYVLFGIFILACGTGHVMAIVTLWRPAYRLEGIVKAITAAASIGTAVMLIKLVPSALALPGPERFKHEIEERRRAEVLVIRLNLELESRVHQRTRQLEEANAHLAALAATLDKAQTFVTKLDETILIWSGGAEAMYGWSREEAVGRNSLELLDTELPQPLEQLQAALMENGSWTGELKQHRSDGSVIWVTSHWALNRDAGGAPVSVVNVNNDVTALKRTGEALLVSEATAQSLFENASQGILTADRAGRIVDANAMTEELFGYSRSELVGASVDMLLPAGLRDRHAGHRAGYAAHPYARTTGQDLVACRKDGSEFPVEVCLSYIAAHRDGGLAVAFISDISARKRTSLQLVAANEALEQALASAREASEHKSRFMAKMSHELRTPLNSIIGFNEILLDKKAGEINEIQEEFLGDSLRSARLLLALINDILDLEKVAAGRRELSLERFDVHQLVRETVNEVSVLAAANQVRLAAETDSRVRFVFLDRQKIKQVLLNLATNAVKFTLADGLVTVRARAAGNERWVLEVQDTGIGISEQDQARLFHEFEQLENPASKRFPGTGLGLALSRDMVEAQGGAIAVVSAVGVGSTFSAILPVSLERRKAAAPDRAGGIEALAQAVGLNSFPETARTRRLLIVDDDARICTLLKLALQDSMLEVACCADGESALNEMARGLPVAVIVDLPVRDLDGFDFIARLKRLPNASAIPILVWTNLDPSGQGAEILRRDVGKVISKKDGGIGHLIVELEDLLRESPVEATAR